MAALAGVVAIAGSLYTASLRRTRDKVKTVFWTGEPNEVQEPTVMEIIPDSEGHIAGQRSHLVAPEPDPNQKPQRPKLNWKRVLVVALVTFGIAAVALTTPGLDIGPLLAGLGVVGIAIGFGAQSLVRDVISGIFFLMEDAFRVGEYIDTGRLRDTVEGMSLRSVRLRHQNGQVHTIPFGQVQSVTNYSRDWSVVKFNLHLDPTADIETVRKTITGLKQRFGESRVDLIAYGRTQWS